MVTYKYRAQDENGKAISGTMQATDELDLHERLKQEKKYLIQAKAQADKVNIKRLRSDVVSEFAKNIGELLGAGVTLVRHCESYPRMSPSSQRNGRFIPDC